MPEDRAGDGVALRYAPGPACMGGWCAQRDHCAHHIAPVQRVVVSERLCERGREQPEPVMREAV